MFREAALWLRHYSTLDAWIVSVSCFLDNVAVE